MARQNKRKLVLSAALSAIDDTHMYEDHYVDFEERGKYGETIVSDLPHTLTISIPWIFEQAPDEISTEVLEYAFRRASVPQKALYGPLACEYLSDPDIIRKLRISVSRSHEFHCGLCPNAKIANRSLKTCRKLLCDHADVMDGVQIKWRMPGIHTQRMVSSDYVAKMSVFDSVLLSDEVRKPLRDYVIYRELCTHCAFSLKRNAVQRWKFELLLHRFPGWQHMEEMCKQLGWKFTVKL